ncbi:MAG: hypothetical protein GXP22_00795 [Gammaproteobacteria bacterium]|nr:hypothetical protein [Gammaproteobacteria bacterium]
MPWYHLERHRHGLASIAVLSLIATNSYSAEEVFRLDNRTDFVNYDLSGPGKGKSFYDEGAHYLQESDLTYKTTLFYNG